MEDSPRSLHTNWSLDLELCQGFFICAGQTLQQDILLCRLSVLWLCSPQLSPKSFSGNSLLPPSWDSLWNFTETFWLYSPFPLLVFSVVSLRRAHVRAQVDLELHLNSWKACLNLLPSEVRCEPPCLTS